MCNVYGKIGGDSGLSERGEQVCSVYILGRAMPMQLLKSVVIVYIHCTHKQGNMTKCEDALIF